MDSTILKSFIPEIFLSFAILLQLVCNIRTVNKISLNFPILTREIFAQTLFILTSLFFLYSQVEITGSLSNFVLSNDLSILSLKMILVVVAICITVIIKDAILLQKLNYSEFFSVYLLAVFSLLIMLSCESLVSFYLAMEMQALCFYVLAAFNRNSVFSVEAGLKYFISGSFISGFYLLGASIIYGCLGTLDIHQLNLLLVFPFNEDQQVLHYALLFGFLLIVFTLLFKLGCAPFHFWSPDVYDGAPLSSTIIFSILPKISIFSFFIKFLICAEPFTEILGTILLVFGVFSTLVGTLFAFVQKRLKKVIIYSSIAQTGFLVSVLSVQTFDAYVTLFFFLFIYLITSMLIWGHVVIVNKSSAEIANFLNQPLQPIYLSDFANMYRVNAIRCVSLLIAFFSVAGVPPLAGFLAKMAVILQLVSDHKIVAAALLVYISAASAYYYIRVIKISFFESNKIFETKPAQVVISEEGADFLHLLMAILLFLLILLFFFPTLLYLLCQYVVICMHII